MENNDLDNVYKVLDYQKKVLYKIYEKLIDFAINGDKSSKEYCDLIEIYYIAVEQENKLLQKYFPKVTPSLCNEIMKHFNLNLNGIARLNEKNSLYLCVYRLYEYLAKKSFLQLDDEDVYSSVPLNIFEYVYEECDINFVINLEKEMKELDDEFKIDFIKTQYNLCFVQKNVEDYFAQMNFNFDSHKKSYDYALNLYHMNKQEYFDIKSELLYALVNLSKETIKNETDVKLSLIYSIFLDTIVESSTLEKEEIATIRTNNLKVKKQTINKKSNKGNG